VIVSKKENAKRRTKQETNSHQHKLGCLPIDAASSGRGPLSYAAPEHDDVDSTCLLVRRSRAPFSSNFADCDAGGMSSLVASLDKVAFSNKAARNNSGSAVERRNRKRRKIREKVGHEYVGARICSREKKADKEREMRSSKCTGRHRVM
jgi:hypothetical protein